MSTVEGKGSFVRPELGSQVAVAVDRYEGLGVVEEISYSSHLGTRLFPSYKVRFSDGTFGWYLGICLRSTDE